MRYRRSAAVLALMIPLVVALAIPGGAAPAQPGESLTDSGFLTGPAEGDPDDLALAYVQREHASLDLEASDVAELAVLSSYVSSHTGVTHVNVAQRHQGLDIFGAVASVSIAADGSVLFVAGSMVEGVAGSASGDAASGAVEAVEAAADALELDAPERLQTVTRAAGAARETVLTDGGISEEPIPARLGWQPTDDGLRLAWEVVIDEADAAHLWNAAVDAETGELLNVDDWTDHHNAEELASSLARSSEELDAVTAQANTTHVPPVRVEDGSSYNVLEIPKESPYDGPRSIAVNPADALGSPFGWHDTDGEPGPEFTRTRGNNVHAYTDTNNSNTPDPDSDPDGGPTLTFDFPLDLTQPPATYADAAVTNLFYWNNIIHDVMYRYGFDEASGNFQANNYGRGGVGGDYVRAEAQDGGGVNNANFSTPAADGGTPRMQMYLWNPPSGLPNLVTVDPPSSAAGTYQATGAAFGPTPDSTGLSGPFAVVNASTGVPSQGCGPLVGFPAGAIAIADRGGCPFVEIVGNAQAAGASAVVVANNVTGAPITMGGADPTITIPSVMVSLADADTIKAGLPATGRVSSNPAALQRDGDLENGIIIHEYGHGVSNRLTGGPGVNCLTGDERMGEGWSDYLAITMLIDPELDDPEGPRGMGSYARYQGSREGAGIRPRPYSRNMEINPFTYDNIRTGGWQGGSLAIPHGIGWGWATVLWDMTWDLIDVHGFNDNIYDDWTAGGNNLSYQLVMDGLKLQGCGPGFVVGRDAILAADTALTGGANHCTLWNSFARRGLGYSAVQGTTARNDNTQAFDLPDGCAPTLRLIRAELDRLVADGGITEGMETRIRHALDMFEAWIQNPRQRGPALSHLDRAVRLLEWQADVVDRTGLPQGDPAGLRALAASIRALWESYQD